MEGEVKKNKNTGLYVIIGILCVMVLALGGYTVYKEFIEKDKDEKECSCTKCDVKDNIINNTTTTSTKCTGYINAEYYGEHIDDEYDEKAHYTFKPDGTFTYYYENSEGNNGTYKIIDGKLYTEVGEMYKGPGSEQKTYTGTYDISDDCSKINLGNIVLEKK